MFLFFYSYIHTYSHMAYVSRYLHMAAHFLSGLVTLSLWNLLSQKPLSAIAVFVLLVRAVPIGRTGAFFSFLLSSFILSLVTHMRPMYIMATYKQSVS